MIIPRDERSGSATDAGVPQFMDFMMIDQPPRQIAMRGGLALIDRLAEDRVGKRFVNATDAQRRQVLDEIAYTTNTDPGLRHAVVFFSSFRDLTASGFWSTKMGVQDLQYRATYSSTNGTVARTPHSRNWAFRTTGVSKKYEVGGPGAARLNAGPLTTAYLLNHFVLATLEFGDSSDSLDDVSRLGQVRIS